MIIGTTIKFEEQLSSTNTSAIKMLAVEKPPEGTIIRAGFQSAGRGQPGNSWESENGKNLLFSIILYPDMISPSEQFLVSMTISLGIRDFVSRHTTGSSVKWPNDIYVKDDKIAGLLIESSLIGNRVQYMVAGIGININQEQFHSNAPNPVSLRNITGLEYKLEDCLDDLAHDLDKQYLRLRSGKAGDVRKDYHSALYRAGEWAEFRDAGGVFTGMIRKVENDGQLTIRKRSGEEGKYYFKEVEFIS